MEINNGKTFFLDISTILTFGDKIINIIAHQAQTYINHNKV